MILKINDEKNYNFNGPNSTFRWAREKSIWTLTLKDIEKICDEFQEKMI